MKNIFNKIIWLVMLIPAIYLATVWNDLPEQVALHFDLNGNPDRIGSKKELILAVMIITVINAGVYLLLINMHKFDPKKNAVANKERIRPIAYATAAFLAAILCLMIYSTTKGSIKLSVGLILSAVGLLFAVIGNYLPNLKPNYFAGLRLPWTLEDSENWRKTHFLAGRLWFAGGLLIAVLCFFLPAVPSFAVFIGILLIITIIPCVYSYRIYKMRKETR